jgi:hypothetical protein
VAPLGDLASVMVCLCEKCVEAQMARIINSHSHSNSHSNAAECARLR